MKIKLVNRPLQDENTKSDDIQYPGEKWCVETKGYREKDGGIKKWFDDIEKINPDVVYLYDIKALHQEINDEMDIVYYVRYKCKSEKK